MERPVLCPGCGGQYLYYGESCSLCALREQVQRQGWYAWAAAVVVCLGWLLSNNSAPAPATPSADTVQKK